MANGFEPPWVEGLIPLPSRQPLVYLAGSMSQRERILFVTKYLREQGFEVFNDWIMPGEETDRKWQEFEQAQGRSYIEALAGAHAADVFAFDKHWLDRADAFVLVYPAGKSAHLELGYCVGRGTPSFILLDQEPERWDVMTLFATAVVDSVERLVSWLGCYTGKEQH